MIAYVVAFFVMAFGLICAWVGMALGNPVLAAMAIAPIFAPIAAVICCRLTSEKVVPQLKG